MAARKKAAGAQPSASDALSEVSFEEALEQLESTVDQLETGDLDLETALQVFEQGVALSRRCAAELERAERRIEVLSDRGEEPFDASADGESS